MREIKFRGKDIDTGKWVFGHYGTSIEMGDNGGVEHMYRETCTKLHYIVSEDGKKSNVVYPETVGQYTNINTNINQEELELYKGDIIRFSVFDHNGSDYTEVGKIVWECDGWAVECENGDMFQLGFITINDDCVEIIGNIHENKELLEGNNEM